VKQPLEQGVWSLDVAGVETKVLFFRGTAGME